MITDLTQSLRPCHNYTQKIDKKLSTFSNFGSQTMHQKEADSDHNSYKNHHRVKKQRSASLITIKNLKTFVEFCNLAFQEVKNFQNVLEFSTENSYYL